MNYSYVCPHCGTRSQWIALSPKAAIREWNNAQRRPEQMTKKNFKDDPALQLVTPEATEEHGIIEPISATRTKQATSYKAMIKQIEARNKRIQCLMQPSLYDKVKALASRRGISLNDLIHTTLETLVERED
jgi:predicted DNA binding CopG/RHH family protein